MLTFNISFIRPYLLRISQRIPKRQLRISHVAIAPPREIYEMKQEFQHCRNHQKFYTFTGRR